MEAYFDNAATTRCSELVKDTMVKTFMEDYGNAASLHLKGVEAEKYIKEARTQISRTLKVHEKELVFTSGGTEANNLAVIGSAMANQRTGKHLITTKIEHASVSEAMRFLEKQGFRVTWLNVDERGMISLEELANAITDETILVSIMYVNNEIGAVEPIEEAAKIIKEENSDTLFHVDAVQAYGKYIMHPKKTGIDLMSVSGHKIHGPKGVGFLYVKEKTKIMPTTFGGGHQSGMRSGTENVPGVAGLGMAAMEAYADLEKNREHLYRLKESFIQQLSGLKWVHLNGSSDRTSAPHIVSVSFDDVPGEVLLHALESKGIYVSSGSACATNRPEVSETLKSIGVESKYLNSTLRFSFSVSNTLEEVSYCVETLKELIPILSRYTRQ